MKKSAFLTALLATFVAFPAVAAEIPASIDQKTCSFKYPKAALLNEEEGASTVQAVVSASGKVESVKLTASSGSKALDKATVEAITDCKFKPGSIDGKPATTTTSVVYVWKLSK
jgi:protein TonB